MRRISELKKQLEELEQARDQEDEEMQGEEEFEEEHDDEQWAEYEAQQAERTWKSQEEDKGTSSKESSYILVDSTKNSPKDKSSTAQGKVAAGTSPKPKEADKEFKGEELTLKTFQTLLEN